MTDKTHLDCINQFLASMKRIDDKKSESINALADKEQELISQYGGTLSLVQFSTENSISDTMQVKKSELFYRSEIITAIDTSHDLAKQSILKELNNCLFDIFEPKEITCSGVETFILV